MKLSIEVARRRWAETAAKRALSATPAWKPLQRYLELTKSTGCSYDDYWELYKAVVAGRAKEVLELGTGASTIVLAHALTENGGGRITSMEESQEWYQHAMANLPRDLPVDIVLSETVEDTFSLFRGIRFRDVPDRPYDFVFVDGPGYKTREGEVTFDFDLISVVARASAPVRAVIDKRVSTCFVLQRLLPGKVRYIAHLDWHSLMPSLNTTCDESIPPHLLLHFTLGQSGVQGRSRRLKTGVPECDSSGQNMSSSNTS